MSIIPAAKRLVLWLLILAVVLVVYWPVRHAGFVWDDTILFHDSAAMRHGDSWLKFLLGALTGYVNYFRPVVAAFFVLQLDLFDVEPGPMHLVSLALHLCNTMLVGLFVARLGATRAKSLLPVAAGMLFYGLHPALVESVVWIECQNELAVTFFALITLLANAAIVPNGWRAVAVGIFFFLAACAKESAIAVPLLIVLFDTFGRVWKLGMSWREALRDVLRSQVGVYGAVLAAGIVYVVLRTHALGFSVAYNAAQPFFSILHFQKICFTLFSYARLAVWPMTGLSPLHVVDNAYFATFSWELMADDVAVVVVMVIGAAMFARGRPLGALILSFAAGLLAVSNVIPVPFVESVYHERYLTLPLAVGTAWCSVVLVGCSQRWRLSRVVCCLALSFWLVMAAVNVRATTPLWSDEYSLWTWAAKTSPQSLIVRDHLLSTYLSREDYAHARSLARQLVDEPTFCPTCMVNTAFLALHDGDEELAEKAMQRLERENRFLGRDPVLLHDYILVTGELRELKKNYTGAEEAYRDAMATDPEDPDAPMQLAALLIHQGRFDEGEKIGQLALQLYAPDERPRRQQVLDRILIDAKRSAPWQPAP